MHHVRITLLLIALTAIGLAFVACGGGDDESEPTPTGTAAATVEATATSAPEPTPTDATAPTATEVAPLPTNPAPDDNVDAGPVQVEVVAQNLSFSPGVISAPAGTAFNLLVANQDNGVSHNLAIFADQAQAQAGNALFATPIEPGPVTQTLAVSSLAPGDYFVWCQIHTTNMTATLRVQ